MNILDQSIEAAGGVSRLAEVLDLEPNVISNWRKRGIPDSWAKVLTLMQRHEIGVYMHSDASKKDCRVSGDQPTEPAAAGV